MSVYTPVTPQQLNEFLKLYSLGYLIKYSGIQAGIENTNYRVTSSQGEFILTIFESLSAKELVCYLELLTHLSQFKFPAPVPQQSKNNQLINMLQGKPAAIFNCLPGKSIDRPSIIDCSVMGEYLAKLHHVSQGAIFDKENVHELKACQQTFKEIKHSLSVQDIGLLSSEIAFQENYSLPDLPRGIIHADLFKDNVLFKQDTVSAILDFYNACQGYLLFDIAVACNDWCIEGNVVSQQKIQTFLDGYQKQRKLTADELLSFPIFLRRAALQFWLSRLEHQLNPKEGALTQQKDPLIFKAILEQHQTSKVLP